jgi:hypothetical protein
MKKKLKRFLKAIGAEAFCGMLILILIVLIIFAIFAVIEYGILAVGWISKEIGPEFFAGNETHDVGFAVLFMLTIAVLFVFFTCSIAIGFFRYLKNKWKQAGDFD